MKPPNQSNPCERNSIQRACEAYTGILLASMGSVPHQEVHTKRRDGPASSSTLCLTKVPQHKLSDRYATQTAVGIAGASKMESPTDNVLQGSVRARSGSPARHRNTGAQGKARTPSSIPNSIL